VPHTGCNMPFVSISRRRRIYRAALPVAVAAIGVLSSPIASMSGQTQETSAATARPPSPRTYRAGTELVALQVSVVDAQRRYVSNLSAEDFDVFEEGARQTIALFAAATSPLDVMLLLDTSSSMTGRMELSQKAAVNFMRALRPADRAAVVLFDNNVRVAEPLPTDRAALESAAWSARPRGGTALYQAMYIALRELAKTRRGDEQLRRQALIVLTDGDDNASSLAFEDVLDEARRSTVTIFAIMPAASSPPPSSFRHLHRATHIVPFYMRALTEETGGRAFMPAQLEDLSGTYREIADELGQQYWLAYVPAPSSGGFKRVSVRVVSRPEMRARTRSGYYAGESSPPGRALPESQQPR
jgi:Ca-activated chloride channel homolog